MTTGPTEWVARSGVERGLSRAERRVFRALSRTGAPMTRAEIAAATGYTVNTVNPRVVTLMQLGLVRVVRREPTPRSRPREYLALTARGLERLDAGKDVDASVARAQAQLLKARTRFEERGPLLQWEQEVVTRLDAALHELTQAAHAHRREEQG